ncbi:uncharacterized protein [Amphiura filiformis]|uniref:uncharacterized protein n=1 Tax=Amphiura filiformis TaxID=82378 RepID=UPI003B20D723
MAGVRNSLASTIDRYFLECAICYKPFNDPRALPCLHPFCFACLQRWARSRSNDYDKGFVTCPTCNTIHRIPEGGIHGFQVHFLVTNLQETVAKEKQMKTTTELCDKHGKKIKYFCENCGCVVCSDCTALDPTHKGHSFIRLNEASKQQSSSLEDLTRRVRNVEEEYKIAIQQMQQVKQNLDRDADAKILAIDEERDAFILQVVNLVRVYKNVANRKKEENVNEIEKLEERFRDHLVSLKRSIELASNVIESGSDSDIISLYPSLSSSLQQLAQSQPTPVDNKLLQIKLEPPSVEQLVCDKLHITATQQTKVSHQPHQPTATNLLPSAAIKPILAFTAEAQINAATLSREDYFESTGKPESSQGQRFSLISKFRSVPSTRHSIQAKIGKKWKECQNIQTSPQVTSPRGIAIHPIHGNIILTSDSPMTVFSRNDDSKHVIKGSPSNINGIAITPNNQYVIPGVYGKNEFHIYNSQGLLVSTTPTCDINNQPSSPSSVDVDSTGRIIVGLGNTHKTVSIHQPDGTLISKYETTSAPLNLSCMPDDKLIISFDDGTLQVMDQSGENASIIQPPPGIPAWHPWYMCCSKQGELYVGNVGSSNKGVYRYVCTGGEYKYLDCITRMKYDPYGIALSADEEELFVVDRRSSVVKLFR